MRQKKIDIENRPFIKKGDNGGVFVSRLVAPGDNVGLLNLRLFFHCFFRGCPKNNKWLMKLIHNERQKPSNNLDAYKLAEKVSTKLTDWSVVELPKDNNKNKFQIDKAGRSYLFLFAYTDY